MQRLADGRIRLFFAGYFKHRINGCLFGLFAATITQSSTATSVLTIGFVNAGIITLVDGIAAVLGANLGSSFILQIATLNPGWFLVPLLVISILLRYVFHRPHLRDTGEILFGLSLLMLGLTLMTLAIEPFRTNSWLLKFIDSFSEHLWFGLLTSALLAAIMQNSTAVIAFVIALSSGGLLPFATGVVLILGASVGACAPTVIASAHASLSARRVAAAQIMITLFMVGLTFLFFSSFLHFLTWVSPGDADKVIDTSAEAIWYRSVAGSKPFIARYLANANTFFACLTLLIFLPLLNFVAKLTTAVIRGKDTATHGFGVKFLDYRVLNTPPVALGQARSELRRMAQTACNALDETINYLQDLDDGRLPLLTQRENLLDLLQKELTNFLVELSHRSSSAESAKEVALMMQMVADFERIGDHCQSLVRLARRKQEWRVLFSGSAERELREISTRTNDFLKLIVHALESNESNNISAIAKERENEIDHIEEKMRNNHLQRLTTGECAVRPGLIFIDMLQAMEQISDHTYSIAKCIDGERR